MSASRALQPSAIGHSLPRRLCATALAVVPAVAWATTASAQAVAGAADPAIAPPTASSALSVPDLTYSLSAQASSTEQAESVAQPDPAESAAAQPSAPSGNDLAGNDLAMKMTNPVTDLWMIQFEFNNFKLEKDAQSPVSGRWVNSLYFQPVLPISLTKKWNLITRPVVTAYQSAPYPTGPGRTNRKTALGDTILAQVFSPVGLEPWIVAAGPTWIFPTAGSELTGQGKWQVGPAVGGGYVTNKFMVAGLVQQWFSFAGSNDRKSTSQMAILPLVYSFFGDGWSLGYSGQILADWKAHHDDRWTVPVGVSLGKVVKFGILPVQIRAGAQYIPIRPEFGPRWNFQLQITPLIPRMIKKTIFE